MRQCIKFIYFGVALYMFWTVFPSIISSSRLYIQLSNKYCWLLVSSQQYLFDKCLLLHVQCWTADDGRKDRPKHVECYSKINKFDIWAHIIGFTAEINYDTRACERQT